MTRTTAKVQSGGQAPKAETGISPNGETLVVPIVGDPIAQVKSPGLLSAQLVLMGENAVVVPAHVAPDAFDAFMAGLVATQNVPGLIITVPHKQAALGHCAVLTERARMAASVNVMRRRDRGWIGDNTDGMGYVEGILAAGGAVEGKRVLLVGAGGAGSAIAFEFLARGAAQLAIHEIDNARRDALIARLEPVFPGKLLVGSTDPTGFDIVANATPLGMRMGDPLPVDVEKLHAGQFAACPITKPACSPFIEAAAAKGCLTMPGLGMFKAQEGLLIEALLTLDADE